MRGAGRRQACSPSRALGGGGRVAGSSRPPPTRPPCDSLIACPLSEGWQFPSPPRPAQPRLLLTSWALAVTAAGRVTVCEHARGGGREGGREERLEGGRESRCWRCVIPGRRASSGSAGRSSRPVRMSGRTAAGRASVRRLSARLARPAQPGILRKPAAVRGGARITAGSESAFQVCGRRAAGSLRPGHRQSAAVPAAGPPPPLARSADGPESRPPGGCLSTGRGLSLSARPP